MQTLQPSAAPDAARGRRAPQRRPKSRLVFDLLHGVADEDERLLREARAFGMDLAQPRAVVLIDAADYVLGPTPFDPAADDSAGIQRRSRQVVSSIVRFFQLPHDTICADLGGGEIAVLKASNSRNLDDWIDGGEAAEPVSPSWANLEALKRAAAELLDRLQAQTESAPSIGVGRYHPGIPGLAASYQDARAALTLGRRIDGPGRVHCLDELGIAAFVGLADERLKVDLARHLLSPLDHEPELIETVDAFFSVDCSPTATAQRLGIHRNTLSYRLAKIASLTGLDPHRFDDAVQIRLALVLRGLGPDAAPVHRAGD